MTRLYSTLLTAGLAATMLVATAETSFARSRNAVCTAYAKKEANHYTNRSVGTGLVAGAAGGALFGTLLNGNKGTVPGLLIGGVAGTTLGAINGAEKKRRVFRMAYQDCMNNY
jgi:Glycine zipper